MIRLALTSISLPPHPSHRASAISRKRASTGAGMHFWHSLFRKLPALAGGVFTHSQSNT